MSSPTPTAVEPGVTTPTPAVVTLTEATFRELIAQATKTGVADVKAEPSKVATFVKAIPSDIVSGVEKAPWLPIIALVVAVVALVLHFPKITGLL